MKKIWIYGTSEPFQRVGILILGVGLLSLFSWMIKEDLSFEEILEFEPYYLPRSRDSFFFHLFFYLIPLGLLMSWGYQILLKLKEWIFKETPETADPQSKEKIKKTYSPPKQNLHFKNNLAAFQFAAKQYSVNMTAQHANIGIIQNIFQFEDGSKQFLVQLADIGKTTLVSGINDNHADKISKGNLVYWGFIDRVEEPNFMHISAIGHVLASLHPEYDPNKDKWVIKEDFTK